MTCAVIIKITLANNYSYLCKNACADYGTMEKNLLDDSCPFLREVQEFPADAMICTRNNKY